MTAVVVAQIEVEDYGQWKVTIGPASGHNTFCFEGSLDTLNWIPVNAQRMVGPGPRLGTIYSNATAGGPALYQGDTTGFKYIRIIQTMFDDSDIEVSLTTNKPRVMYIINEESTLEDSLMEC